MTTADIAEYLTDGLDFETWAAALEDGVLLGQQCQECGRTMTTPKAACLNCRSQHIESTVLSTEGTVYGVIRVAVAPKGFESGYRIGLVKLDGTDGALILGRIDGGHKVGDTVTLVDTFEKDGTPSPIFG